MNKSIIAGVALASIGAAGLALAQFQPPTFDSLDTNRNGSLSKQEIAAFFGQFRGAPRGRADGERPDAGRIFVGWDADGNGSVSKEEFDRRPQPQGGGPGRD